MKIRTGFVSNSSSSSFCLYGAFFESIRPFVKAVDMTEEDLEQDAYCVCEALGKKFGVQFFVGPYGEGYWFGLGLEDLKDDETGKQFRERAETSIEQFAGKTPCSVQEEAWGNI